MSDSKTERLFPPLPKDHPIYKRGYIFGGESYLFGGRHRSPDTQSDQSKTDPGSGHHKPETKEDKS